MQCRIVWLCLRLHSPEWRNGRRGGLKILCSKGRVGSSPTSGTNPWTSVHFPDSDGTVAAAELIEGHESPPPRKTQAEFPLGCPARIVDDADLLKPQLDAGPPRRLAARRARHDHRRRLGSRPVPTRVARGSGCHPTRRHRARDRPGGGHATARRVGDPTPTRFTLDQAVQPPATSRPTNLSLPHATVRRGSNRLRRRRGGCRQG